MAQIFKPVSKTSPILWNWVTLIGPDAQDFLHRVTTVNTKSLGIGQGASGCFLTAQGKIRAYFTLWNFDKDSFSFEFDAGSSGKWKNDLLAAIDQYTFAEKMVLTDLSDNLECCWIFPDESDLERLAIGHLKAGETLASDEEIRISHHGEIDYGRTWLTAWGRPARLNQWVDRCLPGAESLQFSEIEAWRVQALRPRVDLEITETVMPLEIGLRDAVAENKGCYPGQEVIEKIISLGSPPRRFARIDGEGVAPVPGERIFNMATPPAEVGLVTSVTSAASVASDQGGQNGRFSVLGFIRKIHAKEGLQVQFSEKAGSQGAIVKIAPYA